MIKVGFKKIAALLLMLTLILTVVPFAASAAVGDPNPLIETGRTGSITVTKYATADNSRPGNPGTGMSGQTPPANSSYTPLKGAEFVLVQIYGATDVMNYYNGTGNDLVLDTTKLVKTESGWQYNNVLVDQGNIKTGITAENGEYVFSGLSVGIYVLKEVTAPNQITTPLAEDSLISIPMVNTASSSNNGNAEWMYNVFVYPKNHASTGTVELTKQDQNGAKLKDVTFQLSKAEFQSTESGLALPKNENNEIIWTDVTKTVNNSGSEQTLNFTTGADGKLSLANLPSGLYGTQYKLVEVSAPNGYIVNQTPLYFKVNKDNTMSWNAATGEKGDCNNANTGVVGTPTVTEGSKLSITLRNELPSLTKEVQENGGTTWKTDEQYRLDDEITYRLTVYVPNNVEKLGKFEIKDVPQVGITDSENSSDFTVTYGDAANACNQSLTADKYTLTKIEASGNNGQGFKLSLTDATAAGKFIQIVYKAHMNSKAVIAENGNGNTATLTYSKSIGGGDENYTITDEARVYTYQFQITKYKDSVADANKLGAGEQVEFQLLDAGKKPMKVVKLPDGAYRLAIGTDSDTDKLDKMVTNTDSTILIQGLENGIYYLKETKTINGYNLLSAPFAIQVNVTETTTWTSGGGFTATGKVVKTYDSTNYDVTNAMGTSTIINKKGFVLPQTGGMGYLLFCTVGIVLIAGGAALIFGGRKKKIR